MMPRDLIGAVRRNHALEHATVSVLLRRIGPAVRLAGRAVPDGFYIYGRIPTAAIRESAEEGLARLQGGEASLAVTPFCGTNIAVAGILSGLLAFVTMGSQRRLDRLPGAVLAATFGILASQPLGRIVQQHITTQSDLDGISLGDVEASLGGLIHKVKTTAR